MSIKRMCDLKRKENKNICMKKKKKKIRQPTMCDVK